MKVQYVISGFGGYQVLLGRECESIRCKASEFLKENKKAIDEVVNEFGKYSAKDLELRSTIVYLDRDVKRSNKNLSRHSFVGLVKKIKPRFSEETISKALVELENEDYLVTRNA